MAGSGRPDHDARYRALFGHPGVVAQLLRGFADGPWLADLDLERMQRLSATFVTDTGERRESDMIWRIPRRDGVDAYLILLLEFQSTNEPFMVLRVLAYAALLWQQLVREKGLIAGAKLPPLLPVVLYNGDRSWSAPESLRPLVGLDDHSPLWRWQPEFRYHLIETSAFSRAELDARDSLPALWFRLENATDPAEVVAVGEAVRAWLERHPAFAATRAVFAELLRAMMPRPGARAPETPDLLEGRDMLLARAEQWMEQWRQEGLRKGLREGREVGVLEGERKFLLRQLERRFGAPPAWVVDRVHAAETATLEEWGLRLLDATSLDDVFA